MYSPLEVEELPMMSLEEDCHGNRIYVLSNGESYTREGTVIQTKIETTCLKESNQTNKLTGIQKQLKSSLTMSQNSHFFEGVHEYTEGVVKIIAENFDGKVIGGEGVSIEDIMKVLFGEYKPGDKVKVSKKASKKEKKKGGKMSGYTLFGKEMKEQINGELSKSTEEPKPRYMKMAGKLWGKLTKEEKDVWNKKAKDLYSETVSNE